MIFVRLCAGFAIRAVLRFELVHVSDIDYFSGVDISVNHNTIQLCWACSRGIFIIFICEQHAMVNADLHALKCGCICICHMLGYIYQGHYSVHIARANLHTCNVEQVKCNMEQY